jgi:hypothetical protein
MTAVVSVVAPTAGFRDDLPDGGAHRGHGLAPCRS